MTSLPPEVSPAPPLPFPLTNNTASPPSPVTMVVRTPPANGVPQTGPGSNKTTLMALGVGIGIGGAIVLVCVGIFVFWYKRRKRKLRLTGGDVPDPFGFPPGTKGDPFGGQHHYWQQSVPPGILSNYPSSANGSNSRPPPSAGSSLDSEKPLSQHSSECSLVFAKSTFTYAELASATGNFASTNLLGEGGFGYVHKGVLSDGKEVAIKQLKAGSLQGEREFQAEVGTISRVNHRHLVSLEGYCCSGSQRLLVYEYVPNKTLEFHLHGKGQPTINWATRMKIALGSAKGLAYLHDECCPKIIHRDIKAANILLDDNFEAKVADFGLARFYADADTHVSTRVMGTFGYLAPEYALSGKLTDKSDVFSFGVVLLELITGRRPIDKKEHYLDDNIVDWARPLLAQALDKGNFDIVADPRLQKDYDPLEMPRMVACASVCVRHLARLRPKMNQIVLALEGKISLDDLNEGVRPGESAIYDSHGSTDYDKSQYKEDLKKFRKMALEPLENNSSECSGPTSDFGVQPSASSSEGLGNTQEIHSKYEVEPGNLKGGREKTEEKRG